MESVKYIPARETQTEIKVLNSRFLVYAAPVFSVEEAKAYITQIKKMYPEATHHVPAYLIGHGSSVVAHCSDDGEPSGTAGRPILVVLQGSGLGDIVVVVVRYFGGTKLGTGGLARAYSDAVKALLDVLPRAAKMATHTVAMTLSYAWFERVRSLIHAHQGHILDEDFGADILLTSRFAVTGFPQFLDELRELTHGSVEAEILETQESTILPLQNNTSVL